jgi:hypothetical protein
MNEWSCEKNHREIGGGFFRKRTHVSVSSHHIWCSYTVFVDATDFCIVVRGNGDGEKIFLSSTATLAHDIELNNKQSSKRAYNTR